MGGSKQQLAAADGSNVQGKGMTVAQQLRAKAALPQLSKFEYAFWVVMALLAQLNWGLYPVCTRYLQTATNYKSIPTLQLAVAINVIAYPALLIFYTIPSMLCARFAKRNQQQQWQQQRQQQQCITALDMASSASCGALEVPPALLSTDQSTSKAAVAAPQLPLKERLVARARVAAVATAVGAVVALQALTNIYAARLALAYLCRWPSSYFVLLQVTRHLVTGEQILWANRNVALLLFTPLSLIIEGTDWSWVVLLTPAEWGILVYTGVSIYTLGNSLVQSATRQVGSPLVSVFLSMRLIGSILGSIVLLHDVPRSPVTWPIKLLLPLLKL
ncbi:hypothetical protein COO60DRAFT_1643720 [Scenedesmus sp. NREL 46B-D3]|nr:hypothetical protein COO60DRAFT_1643720 [Scenedesmus sp. NREL 46B-D3]